MRNERQEKILRLITKKGSIQLSELEETFSSVSSMTLRRDLILLENENYIVRTKGGAVALSRVSSLSNDEPLYTLRETVNIEAKREIAAKAVKHMEIGRSIFFDSGTTLMCLARIIEDESFTIITSGLNIAAEIMKKAHPSVILLGGQVNRNTISVSGPAAVSHLEKINIDIAFMSASGYSSESGFTVSNISESELKRAVIKKAKKVIILMDSSKLDKVLAFTFACFQDANEVLLEKDILLA